MQQSSGVSIKHLLNRLLQNRILAEIRFHIHISSISKEWSDTRICPNLLKWPVVNKILLFPCQKGQESLKLKLLCALSTKHEIFHRSSRCFSRCFVSPELKIDYYEEDCKLVRFFIFVTNSPFISPVHRCLFKKGNRFCTLESLTEDHAPSNFMLLQKLGHDLCSNVPCCVCMVVQDRQIRQPVRWLTTGTRFLMFWRDGSNVRKDLRYPSMHTSHPCTRHTPTFDPEISTFFNIPMWKMHP